MNILILSSVSRAFSMAALEQFTEVKQKMIRLRVVTMASNILMAERIKKHRAA